MKVPLSRPSITEAEINAVVSVMNSGQLKQNNSNNTFEIYLNTPSPIKLECHKCHKLYPIEDLSEDEAELVRRFVEDGGMLTCPECKGESHGS